MKDNIIEELFDKTKTYQRAILCTYSLDIEFIENYLLNLNGLINSTNLCIFTDRNIYNRQFENELLIKSKWANKRYLLTPVDTRGVFHPKIYILASEKSVRFAIGSANLTRSGLASNLEIVSIFEVTKKDKTYAGLLTESLQFIKELAIKSKSISALKLVGEFIDYVNEFTNAETQGEVQFLHNLEKTISEQVVNLLSKQKVKQIQVISPFYDNGLLMLEWLKRSFINAKINIYIQQGKSNFPVKLYAENNKDVDIYVFNNQERYIHGKAIIFITEEGSYALTGSANFTSQAMLSKRYNGNIEGSLWGLIDNETVDYLIKPNSYIPFLLKNIDDLIVSTIQVEDISSDKEIISDWLIEALLEERDIRLVINDKEGYKPQRLIINDDNNKILDYAKRVNIGEMSISDLSYLYIEGISPGGHTVKSSKIRIVSLDESKVGGHRKRYSISEPADLEDILRDIIKNGTEEQLIEYLYLFNIPLDLVGLNFRSSALSAMDSKGNQFGELRLQNGGIINNPGMEDAVKHFLETNYKKLYKHYENVQLTHINNFILIFGSIFRMMNVIHDNIAQSHRKIPIKANEWTRMRLYYDVLLQYSKLCLDLLCRSDNECQSYSERVTKAIKKDTQRVLGNSRTFKEFVVSVGYQDYLIDSYKIIINICLYSDMYITKGKVLTSFNEIKPMPVSSNGIKDTYIIKRTEIYLYAIKLMKDLESILCIRGQA